ncbi:MAG: leucyl/phenylalanyl-tRNA--protein transferase [Bdellovibrionota bacterium]
MPISRFPDPREASKDGIVALGGDLEAESILLAYSQGIFPWPIEGIPLAWFCPDPRAVLRFSDLHTPKSLEKMRKKALFQFTIDRAFDRVIEACKDSPRPGQAGTWITNEILVGYKRLHRLGYAHSVEAWVGEDLEGGIYGVALNGVFSAESMFYKKPNASKLALLFLIDHLKKHKVEWIDIQMLTPHLKALGATEINRDAFLLLLARSQRPGQILF